MKARADWKAIRRKVFGIAGTLLDEIGDDECLADLDRFVEMKLADLDTAKAMLLVQHHLDQRCDCR
ncbi:MAG TPA: hypothetical protein VMY98_07515 [Anaerolineae bacterium]|nr:hypothetical protein [Anaerolineae bacterium]